MEGNRLTQGWKEFVEAHDLRVGDFVVFRHEGEMLFNVTALGPSCCEIQYAQPRRHEEDEESNDTGMIQCAFTFIERLFLFLKLFIFFFRGTFKI